MKIMMAGGGTAGSVSPLIAIYEQIKNIQPESEFIFITTKKGEPENKMLRGYSMKVISIHGGKFRRYFDLRNILDLFITLYGFFESLRIIIREKPDIVIGSGGYISVPVIWAAWVNRIKILIHQQDIVASLSNILCINLANRITVSFEKSLNDYPLAKTIWTGNPVKKNTLDGNADKANEYYNIKPNLPLVLITGGGTGAQGLNFIVNQALPELVEFTQIIILTGLGKKIQGIENNNFKQYEFIKDGMNDLLARADVVVSRAGLSTISELSILNKVAILIPMPNTHQEKNALYLAEKNAAIVINQLNLSPGIFIEKIKTLLQNKLEIEQYRLNIGRIMKKNSAELVSNEILNLIQNESK